MLAAHPMRRGACSSSEEARTMGFWSRIRYVITGKASIEDWWAEYGPQSSSVGGMIVNQVTALKVSTVLACVAIRSEDVAKLPAHVYRRLPDGGQQIVADHWLERILQRPNDDQSRFEFMEQ